MEPSSANTFDLVVNHRDPKTGLQTKSNPYTLHVVGLPNGEKMRLFERPIGSGNVYDGQNRPAGRFDKTKPEKERHLPDEPHVAFIAPQTEDEKLAASLIAKDAQLAAMQKELDLMKADAAKKAAPAASEKGKKETGA